MAEKVEVVIKIPKYYLTHPQDYSCLAECVRRGIPLEQIRAEIDVARFIDKDTKLCKNGNASGLEVALDIIDKYTKGEQE